MPRRRHRHEPDQTRILLALLDCPEVRDRAGLPPVGQPLSLGQISDWTGLSKTSVHRVVANGLRKIERAMAVRGITVESLRASSGRGEGN